MSNQLHIASLIGRIFSIQILGREICYCSLFYSGVIVGVICGIYTYSEVLWSNWISLSGLLNATSYCNLNPCCIINILCQDSNLHLSLIDPSVVSRDLARTFSFNALSAMVARAKAGLTDIQQSFESVIETLHLWMLHALQNQQPDYYYYYMYDLNVHHRLYKLVPVAQTQLQ